MLDLSITTRLEGEDEPIRSNPNMGTVLRMELYFKLDSGIEALQRMKLEHLAWLAWECRRSDGFTVPPFEKFRSQLVDMDFDADNDRPLVDEGPPIS